MVYVFFIGLGIGLCLILAAAAVFCDTGFKRITMRDIDVLAQQDAKAAQKWRKMILNQDQVVSTFFVAYMFPIIAAVTVMARYWLADMSFMAVLAHIVCVTVFVIVATYYLPKSYVLRQESGFILNMGPLVHVLYGIFIGPAWVFSGLGKALSSAFKNHFQNMPHLIAAEQDMNFIIRYRGIIAAQDPEGLKEAKEQRRMVKSLEEYLEKNVSDIMIPLDHIPMIDGEQPMDVLLDIIFNSHASRMIVYQEVPEQIIGILHVDLFLKAVALAEGDLNAIDLMSAVSEPLYIHATQPVAEQIRAFRQHKQSFALVQDRQGHLTGGISLDRLLEQTALLLVKEDE